MFREDNQELIVQANGLINIMPKILTDLQVLRSKPTTHAVGLQVSIKPFSKVLVLASIANKAGIVLDRMGHQRAHVDNEVIWNTSSAQKDLRNMACGAVDGINANSRWISMLHCLKPFHRTQINVIELCPSYFRAADLSIPEVRATEIGATQVSIAQIGITEIGIPEISTPQVIMAEVGIAQVRVYVCMLLSPCIPNIPSLPQQAKLLSIYQVAHLLLALTL
jgi:hypothetical protein